MRRVARILTIVTMAALGILLVCYAGVGLRPAVVEAQVQPATEQAAAFETISTAIRAGEMGSDQFKVVSEPDPARYEMITYRVRVRNPGILGAQWVRLKLTPTASDVALLATPVDIGTFGTAEVTATLLTEAGGDVKRDVWIEYYILGNRMSAAASWSTNG
jgi:hypothetical protein